MLSKTLAFASLAASTFAAPTATDPKLTIKELPAQCSSYPGYNADTNSAGPWSVMTTGSDNPKLVDIGLTTTYAVGFDPNSQRGPYMRWGYVSLNREAGRAQEPMRCTENKLQIRADTALTPAGAPTNYGWTDVVLSPYPYNALPMYLLNSDVKLGAFEHYVDGVKQDGVFLGGYNTTTWGMKWMEESQGSYFHPYFQIQLKPEGQALEANETITFMKIWA